MGLVLISLERIMIEKSLRLSFSATNNEAEYEALLVGMIMVQKMSEKTVEVFSDKASSLRNSTIESIQLGPALI